MEGEDDAIFYPKHEHKSTSKIQRACPQILKTGDSRRSRKGELWVSVPTLGTAQRSPKNSESKKLHTEKVRTRGHCVNQRLPFRYAVKYRGSGAKRYEPDSDRKRLVQHNVACAGFFGNQ